MTEDERPSQTLFNWMLFGKQVTRAMYQVA